MAITLTDIPHLKVYRQRTAIPINPKTPDKGSLIFLITPDLATSVDVMKSPMLNNLLRFRNYYMDSLYRGSFFGRSYYEFKHSEREDAYKTIGRLTSNISTRQTITGISGNNTYVDLIMKSEIFTRMANRAISFPTIVDQYMKFLKESVENEAFSQYDQKMVIIEADSWLGTDLQSSKPEWQLVNPVFLIQRAAQKNFAEFQALGNINFYLFSGNSILRFNPSLMDANSYMILRREMVRLDTKQSTGDNTFDESAQDKLIDRWNAVGSVVNSMNQRYNLVGDLEDRDIIDTLADAAEEKIPDSEESSEEIDPNQVVDDLDVSEDLIRKINTIMVTNVKAKSDASTKRDEELRKNQHLLELDGIKLSDIMKRADRTSPLESIDVSKKIKSTNPNVGKVTFPHFEKAYNERLKEQDTLDILMSLNDASIPIYLRSIDKEDSSNELSLKETYTVHFEDTSRTRHTLKFDMPKFIDDRFMYLNGNLKTIVKQFLMKPVVKIGPDEVQVVTNHNKIFIRRYGHKTSSKIEKMKKALFVAKNEVFLVIKRGNNTKDNRGVLTTIEYDEFAREYTSIEIGNTEYIFNQSIVQERLRDRQMTIKDNELCIGFEGSNKSKPILLDLDTQMIKGTENDIVDHILNSDAIASIPKVAMESLLTDAYQDATVGKKYIYSRATIMAKQVPVILLLSYLEGLTTVMNKAGIKYKFSDKRVNVSDQEGIIRFSDGYLIYDKYPYQNALLMNGFGDIPTQGLEYADMDDKVSYLDIFQTMFGVKMIANAFDNFYDLMIDPITKGVLQDLGYPTKFVELIIFANSLLSDNAYTPENKLQSYRVRSNEIVNVFLYQAIGDAYKQYRMTAVTATRLKCLCLLTL